METQSEKILNDLLFFTLDHAINSLTDIKDTMIPFIIVEDNNKERILERFFSETFENSLIAAQNHINKEKDKILRYCIAWDGFVTIEMEKYDAILIEAGDKNGSAQLICQRYKRKGILKNKFEIIGNPTFIENPISRI